MSRTPIGEYALLSDRHSAALVAKDGAVDWWCLPRFDSPSVFGALLDEAAGSWRIRPVGEFEVSRRYVEATMVLETTFETAGGVLALTDALATGPERDPHRLGARAPHLLVRSARCVRGRMEVEVSFAPRPEYGLVAPLLQAVPGGLGVRGGPARLLLSAPVDWDVTAEGAVARARVEADQVLWFALQWSALGDRPPRVLAATEIAAELETTLASWRDWSDEHQNYQGPYRELVHHSGRVLQALSYQPTGAITAAATTSLPEQIGGQRNWDYRYAWVRDASFTLNALWVAACPDEAGDFFSFLTTAAATYRPREALQIMFGIGGEHDLSERELSHLGGWRGSRPVRVGNDAWRQPQLDVYGELLDAAHRLSEQLTELDQQARDFLASLADAAACQWRQPDHGIWEIRDEPRHYLYSKVMCWVALDRAIALAGLLRAADHVPGWRRTRREIRQAVLEQGWNERAGAFTQAFGSADLDASALMMPIVGFLPADDPRMLATIDAIAGGLTDEQGLVYRYLAADGLAGDEGTFLLCTFWLSHALALAGQTGRARQVFETAAAFVTDVGLLAEEVHPGTGELLGNFPQAFSHIGLINAAWAIHRSGL
ncbi:glycoside hydrolase family 15 protein [Nonomuraea basaltis]|uniref:glycoside hydrolase family 15 protein n=1 Tax=Nonomuraea basaltis TaxID=2495887 RepID=UPI00110C5237|nr:glycoside hydrolase family 15 protein [Nonomuraea basaltis]TMS00640.1 glycoside hydrolase family 15 protein [Nonomuraea basaltis]